MRLWTWVLGAALVGTTAARGGTMSFSYTGLDQTFTVPGGVTSLNVSLWGAGGAGATLIMSSGGAGAYVTGDLAVTPAQQMVIIVGGGGAAASSTTGGTGGFGGGGNGGSAGSGELGLVTGGGGGGGYSGIFSSATLTGANALVVAGGGGGSSQLGNQGALPTLTAGDGSDLLGGNGGDGGSGAIAGGAGGGGAGGGYNGGAAGIAGAPGGVEGGNGTDGGPAGSFLSNLTNSGSSSAPTSNLPVGTSDPNYVIGTGGGGASSTDGENGEIVITWVPEPTFLSLLAVPFALALTRRRNRAQVVV